MHVARFLGPRLPGEYPHQRRLAITEALDVGLHVVEGFKVIHALAAAAEFSGSLWAAKHKNTDYGNLAAIEVEDLLQAMFIFRDPAVGPAGRTCETLLLKRAERLADGIFVQTHDRVAVVLLVAGVYQSVQRQRVVVRSSDVLFDQGAEGSDFGRVELERGCGHQSRKFISETFNPGDVQGVGCFDRLDFGGIGGIIWTRTRLSRQHEYQELRMERRDRFFLCNA